jgi:small subunit ribosomal protein S6
MPQQPDERGITKGGTVRERIRNYEMIIIISPLHADDEAVEKIVGSLRENIESFGGTINTVSHSSPWGRRKLAYPIRAYAGDVASRRIFHEGFYVLMTMTLSSARVRDLEVAIKYTDPILRHLIVLLEDAPRGAAADAADAAAADIDSEDEYDEDEDIDADDEDLDEDIDADDEDLDEDIDADEDERADTEVVHNRAE